MKTKTTTNYAKFKLLNANRDISNTHVERLIESIRERNLLKVYPILANENFEVIDGQHRLEAAKRMGIPIYYVIEDDTSIDTVKQVNVNQKEWKAIDYIKSYAAQGLQPYRTLLSLRSDFSVGLGSILIVILQANKKDMWKLLKKGELEPVIDYEDAYRQLTFIDKMARRHRMFANQSFVKQLIKVVRDNDISWGFLADKVVDYPRPYPNVSAQRDVLRLLEEVANFNQKTNTFRFF